MIFRRRKKAPVVKYNYDSRFGTELRDHTHAIPSLADTQTAFEAWATYPAMKSCDMIRKLPSHCTSGIFQEEPIVKTLKAKYKNIAKFNIELWKHMKSKMTDISSEEGKLALQRILTGGMSLKIKTVRMCPPIKDLLTQTLVIKCPVDMHFAKGINKDLYEGVLPLEEHLKNDTAWHWTSPATHLHSRSDPFGESHPTDQFCHGEDSQIKGWSNLKINTGLLLDMPDHITAVQHQPIFHNVNLPMKVIPGIFNFPTNKAAAVIPNFFIHKDQEDFMLKKGDALTYITFSEPVNLVADERGDDYLIKFAFDGPQLSWRNLAKKLRYDGKE